MPTDWLPSLTLCLFLSRDLSVVTFYQQRTNHRLVRQKTKKKKKQKWISEYTRIHIICCFISFCWLVGWLSGWFLRHINLCRLFNAKSIFIQIVLFQTIQFSMSTEFNCQKTFLFQTIQFSETVLIQTIQFSIATQFSSIWPVDRTPIRCYHSGPEWTWEWWQWRDTPHSPKLQHYCNLTIRLFSVISRTLVVGWSYPSAEVQSVCSTVHEYTVSLSKTYLFQATQFSQTILIQTIQFSVSTVKCQNSSILNNSV